MVENIPNTIYLDLDTLLDTRMGLLVDIDPDLASSVMKNELYDYRLIDEFGYLPNNIFKQLYNKRPHYIITNSYLTDINKIINLELKNLLEVSATKENLHTVIIELNTFPYRISDVMKNKLKDILYTILNSNKIEVVVKYFNPITITSTELTNKYISLYMYNGINWLNYMINFTDIQNNNAVNTNLIVPYLLENPVILNKEEEYQKLFDTISDSLAYYIKVNFIPVKFFNIKKEK